MTIESHTLLDRPTEPLDRLRIDRLPLAYIVLDPDGRVREWNRAAEELFGYSRREALGQIGVDLIVPLPLSDRLREILRRVRAGDMEAHSVNENRTKDGRLITCQWHNTPILAADGRYEGLICLAEDVSSRIRAGLELEESHALLRSVIEFIPDAIYMKDREGRYLWINAVAARAIDKPVEQVLGYGDTELLSPETAQGIVANDRAVIESGTTMTFQEVAILAGQTRIFLTTKAPYRDANGDVLGILGIARDITAQRSAEDQLKRQKERLQTIVDHIPIMLRFVDADGRFQLVNRRWEETLGWTLEDLWDGAVWTELYPDPQARQRVLEFIRVSDGKWVDFKTRVRDGRILDTRWASVTLSDGTKVGVGEDITERKRQDLLRENDAVRLRALSHTLVQLQEEERRHLSRELHDEIGQKLTGLRFLLQATTGDGAVEPRLEEARGLVDEILEKVRGLSADLRPAPLDHLGLVPALITLFERYSSQTRVAVDFKHQGAEGRFAPDVEITAYRIVQEALTNVARHAEVDQVKVRVWTSADRLTVQITDRGRGFDPEAVLSSPRTGGLTGMQERVKLLGGKLTIESDPGRCTLITAELPCTPAVRTP
jgi:PAS domain S-box-containing protein